MRKAFELLKNLEFVFDDKKHKQAHHSLVVIKTLNNNNYRLQLTIVNKEKMNSYILDDSDLDKDIDQIIEEIINMENNRNDS